MLPAFRIKGLQRQVSGFNKPDVHFRTFDLLHSDAAYCGVVNI